MPIHHVTYAIPNARNAQRKLYICYKGAPIGRYVGASWRCVPPPPPHGRDPDKEAACGREGSRAVSSTAGEWRGRAAWGEER
jgi:hypothetical protein